MSSLSSSSSATLPVALQKAPWLKAIAGIANFNPERVAMLAKACQLAGIAALDVAACPELIAMVRQQCKAVLFVSSVKPTALLEAARCGADVLELGNFDALYVEGVYLNADDVSKLASTTLALLKQEGLNTPLCVTVPGHLSTGSQVQLARQLEAEGVAMLQTEGASRLLSEDPKLANLSPEEQRTITLNNTRVLSAASSLPIMSASGFTADTLALGFEAGAISVGLGRWVSQCNTVEAMTERLLAAQAALALVNQQAPLETAVA